MKRGLALSPVLALLVFLAVVPFSTAAEKGWVLKERFLPLPSAASQDVQKTLSTVPVPDVDKARRQFPTTEEGWLKARKIKDEKAGKAAMALAKKLSVSVRKDRISGVTVYWLNPAKAAPGHKKHLFIHTHGGAYVFNAGRAAVMEGVLIAAGAGIPVVSIDYRMPPLHPFPRAINDVVSVYRKLLEKYPPSALALGGTSAGGGLTLASVLKFMELGLPLPGALFAGTPWADLTRTGDSFFTNEGADHILVTYDGLLKASAELYANGEDLKNPLLSPLYGDFGGFPPTFVVSGTRDLFLSLAVRVHRKIREAGSVADLNVYEGLSHADYIFMAGSPESREVFRELGLFLDKHLE